MENNNISDVLLNVRASYRLLYQYQRAMLDLANFIGKKYRLTFDGGYPKFSNPAPNRGNGRLDLWAWDWLNMYFYEFHYKSVKVANDTIHFSVFVVSDNGYFQAKKEKNIQKTDIDKFAAIEDSNSYIILVAGKNIWEGWRHNWNHSEFILELSGEKKHGDDKSMFFKRYLIEDMSSQEAVMKNLEDFSNECKKAGISVSVNDDEIK